MDGSSKAQWAAYAVGAILLAVGAVFLLGGGGGDGKRGGQVALDAGVARPSAGGSGDRSAGGGPLYVHVAGAVRRPGVYRLPAGARVAAAVRKAGGLTRRADLTAFNLAAPLRDAQQVIVPKQGEGGSRVAAAEATADPAAGTGPGAGAGAHGGKQVSLRTATPEQLDALDGIGPKLAAAIVAYRNEHHGFKSVDELREVDGIGEKRFAALRQAVRP